MKYFLPLYISSECHSVRPTAAISMAQDVAVAVLVTTAAQFYQRHNHHHAFVWAAVSENTAVVCGGVFLILFVLRQQDESSPSSASLCHAPMHSPLFHSALMLGCIDAICSSLLSTVISKEWLVLLFSASPPSELALANARLSQIDLVLATLAPLYVSKVIQTVGYTRAFAIVAGQHVLGAFVILYSLPKDLHMKSNHQQQKAKPNNTDPSEQLFQLTPGAIHRTNPFSGIYGDATVSTKVKLVTTAVNDQILYSTGS